MKSFFWFIALLVVVVGSAMNIGYQIGVSCKSRRAQQASMTTDLAGYEAARRAASKALIRCVLEELRDTGSAEYAKQRREEIGLSDMAVVTSKP